MTKLDFSIITPSYNMLPYLKCCCSSITDQKDVSFEHIVVDAQSTDGTVEWLKNNKNIRSIIEKDNGMYDAINKGLKIASGDILAYLNCDEQYLPGTLEFVKKYFDKNPGVDILFGDFIAIKPDGTLVAYRKAFKPRWHYIAVDHLYTFTCTMFFRKKIIDDGNYFDSSLRDVADSVFVVNLLRKGYKARHAKKYFSAFTMRGENMFLKENALKERLRERQKYPMLNSIRLLIRWMVRVEKLFNGAYFQKFPFSYSIFLKDNLDKRSNYTVYSGTFRLFSNK